MQPDDPRHGTYAGAVQHWFDKESLCDDCARAEWRYRKNKELRHLRGDSPTVPSIGTVRRFQALQALGWTGPEIAAEVGVSIYSLRSISYHGSAVVHSGTAAKMAAAYERMCMTRPEGHYANRARAMAARKGWPPPLAWDDIDDPDEKPRKRDELRQDSIDHVIVQRVLDGKPKPRRLTNAEGAEITRRALASGMSTYVIERRLGLKPERYARPAEEDVA